MSWGTELMVISINVNPGGNHGFGLAHCALKASLVIPNLSEYFQATVILQKTAWRMSWRGKALSSRSSREKSGDTYDYMWTIFGQMALASTQ